MTSISYENVTKCFDRRVLAVSDLTLDVPSGQFMVLVGPSGCGKTTTLRLLAGLEHPDTGLIRMGNQVVNATPPVDRDVAMVFQEGVLYPHMDVYGNMAFALKMAKQPRAEIERCVIEAADMLGIRGLLGRKPDTLSGGQRRRVALGRAIVRRPKVFLFDEPLSNLDAGLRLAMRSELKILHQRLETTTLYVTHDQAEAMALGQRIAVMRSGRIQQVGPPGDIYNRPANRFVAGFFGTPPMNFLKARVLQLNGDSVGLKVAGERFRMPDRLQTSLADRMGQNVHVGIRPQDLCLTPGFGHTDCIAISGTVTALEPLGWQTDVHVALSSVGSRVISAGANMPMAIGDAIRLYVDPNKIHLFDIDEEGCRLST